MASEGKSKIDGADSLGTEFNSNCILQRPKMEV